MRCLCPDSLMPSDALQGWRAHWRIVVVGLLLVGLVGPAVGAPRVTDVGFTPRSDGQGYVMRVHLTESISAYGIPQRVGPNAVEWVLYGAELGTQYEPDAPQGPVTAYSTARQNGHLVLRIEFDPDRSITTDAYRDRASSDLLLNLEYASPPPVADAASPDSSSPPVQPASTGSSAESSSTPSSESSASSADRDASPSASTSDASTVPPSSSGPTEGATQEARERWKLDTVVIDPGHGGKDPGATANGHYEKTIVLDVAKKLGGYLRDKLDLNVVYTRKTDRFIPLKERGHMANQAGAKLFISLHVNAARSRAAKGTETYFLGRHKTEAARKVMERENSVIRYEENTERYETYDPQKLVVQELAQSMFMQKSEELAGLIQNQFANRVHRTNRGVHQAGFYVLWSASMPSVLVELGFLSNPSEARFLTSDRGKTYLASAIFRAVRAYKAQYEKGIETAARN